MAGIANMDLTEWVSGESGDYSNDPFTSSVRPASLNRTDSGPAGSPRTRLVLEVVMVLMALGAVTGNILVIVIVAATKAFHCVTSVLLINLAVSDLLVGIGVMPFIALSLLYDRWGDCTDLCLYVGYTSSVYCTASVLTLAAIALDRYHAIVDCLHYSSQTTVWRTVAAVIWIWLQAAVTSCPPLLGWSNLDYIGPMYNCAVDWSSSPSYTGFVAALSFLLPAGVMVFCYVKIVGVARGHARRIHDLEEHLQRSQPGRRGPGEKPTFARLIYCVSGLGLPEGPAPPPCRPHGLLGRTGLHGREQLGLLRLFLVIFAFFCCWLPYITVALVQAVEAATSPRPSRLPPSAVTLAYWLALLNSDINPLLYALLSRRFQRALRSLRRRLQARVGQSLREPPAWAEQHPRATQHTAVSSLRTASSDRAAGSSLFSLDSCAPEGYRDHRDHLSTFLPGGLPPSRESARGGGEPLASQLLQVPSAPVDRERIPVSASAGETRATFFYGQITVKVEHVRS
ncbi:beta-3 adrenergic receptor [Amia ocellicauda]|uniref:beta-3 adrenergic receptor n=1 Tax=Amia ocellicauda TaxID=2972642 RepID=UPI003463C42F